MGVAGSLTYDTKLDTKGFQKGVNDITNKAKTGGTTVKNIVAGLGITKIISKAFQVISSSVDSAISRIDTLKNFPKVMSNLGIGSEDATKSINKLSEKLKGIPTKLDDAALAVQRFTSANGDIEKSTDIFLAVNNAILAGGASADIQASALEQLSQAYAKGKPDMVEWRTLQTAMPAQLKQVADAMGTTSDALGEGLRTGTISMDEFIDKIVEMNKEGVNGFTSFEEQAKNATGGINTSITNMKTAISRGVADLIQKVDDGLSKFGGLSGVISKIGEIGEKALKKIGQYLPKAIKFIKDIIPPLITIGAVIVGWKIGSSIQKMVKGFQEAKLALKLFSMQAGETTIAEGLMNGTLKATEGIVALLTGKMTLAELAQAGMAKAQALLNAVMTANPIGLIVAAIAGLVAAFVLLWNKCEAFRNFWIGLWEGIKNVFSTIVEWIKENWQTALLFLISPLAGIVKVIFDNFDKIKEIISNVINAIIDWFNSLPEKIGYAIGLVIGHIIKLGINLWNWVTTELPKIISGIINWFKELPGKIWEQLKQIPSKVVEMANNLVNTARTEIPKFINTFVNFMKELPGKMLDIGKNIVKGIWNGINNAKDWLIGKIKDFAKGITSGIKKALGIKSPSRVMRDQVGQWIPKGIAVGIEANTDSALKSLDELSDEITTKMQNAVYTDFGKMSFSGTSGSVTQILNANSSFTGNINNVLELDGEVVYNNQQKITARKNLQRGGVR